MRSRGAACGGGGVAGHSTKSQSREAGSATTSVEVTALIHPRLPPPPHHLQIDPRRGGHPSVDVPSGRHCARPPTNLQSLDVLPSCQ